jgi:hypothetical protein
MALDKFRVSPLPNPPAQYDPQYMRQVIRVLETYFSQLDSNTPNHAQQYTADAFVGGSFNGTSVNATSVSTTILSAEQAAITYQASDGILTNALISFGHKNGNQISDKIMTTDLYANMLYGDGRYVSTPYNQLTGNSSQTAANTATAYAVSLDTSEYPDGISIASGSRIMFAQPGVYNIVYSLQLKNTNNDLETVDIWFRKNGTDLTNSNTRFAIPARKSAETPSYLVAVTPIMVDITAANQYIEIMWRVSNTTVSIEQIPAVAANPGVTPAIPAAPAAIVGVTFVSAQFPPVTRVAPLPVFGFGQIGAISVVIR